MQNRDAVFVYFFQYNARNDLPTGQDRNGPFPGNECGEAITALICKNTNKPQRAIVAIHFACFSAEKPNQRGSVVVLNDVRSLGWQIGYGPGGCQN